MTTAPAAQAGAADPRIAEGPRPGVGDAGLLRIREALPAWQSLAARRCVPVVVAARSPGSSVTAGAGRGADHLADDPALARPRWCGSFPLAVVRPGADPQPGRLLRARGRAASCVAVAIAFPLGVLMGAFTKVKAAFTPLTGVRRLPADPDAGAADAVAVRHRRAAEGGVPRARVRDLPAAADRRGGRRGRRHLPEDRLHARRRDRRRPSASVLLPISWPDIYQALRLGFGVGWSYILLAEMVDIGKRARRHHHHLAAARPARAHLPRAAGHRRWSPSSPTSCGLASAGGCSRTGRRAMSARRRRPARAAEARRRSSSSGTSRRRSTRRRRSAVHRAQGHQLPRSRTSRATASSSPSSARPAAASRRSST